MHGARWAKRWFEIFRSNRYYDYVSPSLPKIRSDGFFPQMIRGDQAAVTWPYFRQSITHKWYVDRRHPLVGFLNRDEASLLYANASRFAGKRGIEIGAWRGWSTCHLALAGLQLDVVDPVFQDGTWRREVMNCLEHAGAAARVMLHPKGSPTAVTALATAGAPGRSFAFIDGNHEAPAPKRDTLACLPHMAETAMIMFHDIVEPAVSEGLEALRAAGWQTLVYQTSQMMGVGWRGNVCPVTHWADPCQTWTVPEHIRSFPISGESPARACRPFCFFTSLTRARRFIQSLRLSETFLVSSALRPARRELTAAPH